MTMIKDISSSVIAEGLDDGELKILADIAELKRFYKDEIIFSETEYGDKIYILVEGKVCIERKIMPDPHMFPRQILTVKKGQIFGEMAFVERRQRSATARTKSNGRLLIIDNNKLIEVLDKNEKLGYKLMRNLATILSKRLRRMNEQWFNAHARNIVLPEFDYF